MVRRRRRDGEKEDNDEDDRGAGRSRRRRRRRSRGKINDRMDRIDPVTLSVYLPNLAIGKGHPCLVGGRLRHLHIPPPPI